MAVEETEEQKFQGLLKGLVQIFTTSAEPLFEQPWTKAVPSSSTGSGFIIDVSNRLLLTNAHCVTHARVIQVRKEGDVDKHEARILSICHQVDIAILTIDDNKFWEGADVITFGRLPSMHQHVDVIGYPTGGNTVCITSGVVSRIDFTSYTQSREANLCIQIDAAINPGNSGNNNNIYKKYTILIKYHICNLNKEHLNIQFKIFHLHVFHNFIGGPALSNGKLIGIAFQGQNNSQNIG